MARQNFYVTKLFTDIGASDTVITLETPPTATSGRLTLEARNATQREIIKYTGVSGNQITGVTRGHGGTTAKPHSKNALVEMNLTAGDIDDLYDAFNTFAASAGNGWYNSLASVTAVTANGNRSYDLTVNTDLRNLITPGFRLRTTRTVPAPTQSVLLNGTNQYLVKTSPSGMTFTDDFAVSGWIKISSLGVTQTIVSRYNGTSGWLCFVDTNGNLQLSARNGSSTNYSTISSSQSVPPNQWVFFTAQLDMSSFVESVTASYIMFDGVAVPSTVSRGGTNPTSLVQAGNLEVGSYNGGTAPFGGELAQIAVFNSKITQASAMSYYSQGLTGSETSLISAYSFNNTPNDLAATGNTLTPMNSPTYASDAPFGGQADGTISSTLDYGIIQKITATTLTVQVAEGCTIPTSGGVASIAYSSIKTPYGFPSDDGKWTIQHYCIVDSLLAGAALTWYNAGRLYVPAGKWNVGFQAALYVTRSGSGTGDTYLVLSPTTSANTDDKRLAVYHSVGWVTTGAGSLSMTTGAEAPRTTTAPLTALYLNHYNSAGSTSQGVSGSRTPTVIYAKNAYL